MERPLLLQVRERPLRPSSELPYICSKTVVKVSFLGERNKTVKSGCSGQRMPMLGSSAAVCSRCWGAGMHSLHPTFQFTPVRNLCGVFNTTERHTHAHSQFLLGLGLSLKDCFCFVEFRRLILFNYNHLWGSTYYWWQFNEQVYSHQNKILKFFKKQSVLIALIYFPGIFPIYSILLTFLHNLKTLFMHLFPQFPLNGFYVQSYIYSKLKS